VALALQASQRRGKSVVSRLIDRRLGLGPLDMLLVLAATACQGELDATLDVLPERYPNQLRPGDATADVVVFSPTDAIAPPRGALALASAAATARSGDLGLHGEVEGNATADGEVARGEVAGSVELRDIDADGRRDAIARFDIAALHAAGLLDSPHGIEVRIEGQGATWLGHDRLFDADEALVVLPEPSGPFEVGAAALTLFDPSRPGNTRAGRGLSLRLWYPAAVADRQPAPYFLDPRAAERNLRASPLPLPEDLYEATHAHARERVPIADAGPYPALILSTEWGAPVETYAALAEDFASHGYLVFGVDHPGGSGVVVYPDGSEPEVDPIRTVPDEANNAEWARDIAFVAHWLQAAPSADGARVSVDERAQPNVQRALRGLDAGRIAALGHSFGGAAAVRADAESVAIVASADLDGALVGDVARFAESARTMVLLSPGHSELDSSIDEFFAAAGPDSRRLTIDGTLHSNFGDTSWLYARVLAVYPDLTREGYQLGVIDPQRSHAIITSYLRAFFASIFDGVPSALLEGPSPEYPEVRFR
jgi:dienelactone hydrolase